MRHSPPAVSSAYNAHPTIEDLAGLKVSHDFEAMDEGEERILTLKDSRVLEDEGAPMRKNIPFAFNAYPPVYCRGRP